MSGSVAEVAERLTSKLNDDRVIELLDEASLLFWARAAERDGYSVAAE